MRDETRISNEEVALRATKRLAEQYSDPTSMYYQRPSAVQNAKDFLEIAYGPKYATEFKRLMRSQIKQTKQFSII